MKFKSGDKVVCMRADDSNYEITKGSTYTVDRYDSNYSNRIYIVGSPYSWFENRFELASRAEQNVVANLRYAVEAARNAGYDVECSIQKKEQL